MDRMEEMVKEIYIKEKKVKSNLIMKEMSSLFKSHLKKYKKIRYTLFNGSPTIPTLLGFIKTCQSGSPMTPVILLRGGPLHRISKWILIELKIIYKGKFSLSSAEEMECLKNSIKRAKRK